MIDLSKLHSMVWQFRRETADVFPVPNREDSLRFAFTEAGEAMDAHLRTNGEYKRNRDKAHSENREWAQCLMMLLTAWGEEEIVPTEGYFTDYQTLDHVCYRVAYAMAEQGRSGIALAAEHLCRLVGPSIENELAEALDALRAKHLHREEVSA